MAKMKRQKGQDLIEYAFLLALIVAVGAGIYSAGMSYSISNVFAQSGSLLGGMHQRNSFLQFLLVMILSNVWGKDVTRDLRIYCRGPQMARQWI